MALDWNGYVTQIVDMGSTTYETRVHRQIMFAGIVGLALILIWKVIK
jgi:hypothetical protein